MSRHHATETYTAEPSSDGTRWFVIQRRWRRVKRHQARPVPIERIIHTFDGPDAKRLAFECVAKLTGKRDKARAHHMPHSRKLRNVTRS